MSYKTLGVPALDGVDVAALYKGKPEALRLGFRIEELKRDIELHTRPGFKNRIAGRLFTAKRKQDAIEAGEAAVLAMRTAGYSRSQANGAYGKAYFASMAASDAALIDKIEGMRDELERAISEHDSLLGLSSVAADTDAIGSDEDFTPDDEPVDDTSEGHDNEI